MGARRMLTRSTLSLPHALCEYVHSRWVLRVLTDGTASTMRGVLRVLGLQRVLGALTAAALCDEPRVLRRERRQRRDELRVRRREVRVVRREGRRRRSTPVLGSRE